MQLAVAGNLRGMTRRFRLPPAVPPFSTRTYRLFTVLWVAAFLLAIGGPLAGFYYRYTSPSNNSQLLLGSRAGFAVAPRDATLVRFTVGPEASGAGIKPGFENPLPSGNLDLAPTIQHLLGLDPPAGQHGRILHEALADGPDPATIPVNRQTVRAQHGAYRQSVQLSQAAGTTYLDFGNSERS
jgi:hypothetical protein